MRLRPNPCRGWSAFVLVAIVYFAASVPSSACSIFVLTDSTRALFCNNEDYLNSSFETHLFDAARAVRNNNADLLNYGARQRIWFVPAGSGYYGCAYVGYGDGVGQGGLNTQGLSYDWVAGFHEKWTPPDGLTAPVRVPSMQMLETCATVDQATAYFRKYFDGSFYGSTILVADKSGTSVMIGVKDGQLRFDKSTQTRGFGAGGEGLQKMLAESPEPTVVDGFKILRACSEKDVCVTVYSNIFDLKTGDIYLSPSQARDDEFKLNLQIELGKGAHYYEMSQIRAELAESPKPLLRNMTHDYYDQRASHPSAYVVREFGYVSWLIRTSTLFFALFWIPARLCGKLKGAHQLALMAVPLVSALCASILNFVLAKIAVDYFFAEQHLGSLTIWSASLYCALAGFILTVIWSIILLLFVPRSPINPVVWWYTLVVVAANSIVAGYLIYWLALILRNGA